MRALVAFLVVVIAAASTTPSTSKGFIDTGEFAFAAPTTTDHRSPCPALNTLANHNILNRNGQGITLAQLVAALQFISSDNFGKLFAEKAFPLFAKDGLLDLADTLRPVDPAPFNMDTKLGGIEHFASLSRVDRNLGDRLANNLQREPDAARVDRLLAKAVDKKITQNALMDHRSVLIAESDKSLFSTASQFKQRLIGTVEGILAIKVLGGKQGAKRTISVEYARSFFVDQRLPGGFQRSGFENSDLIAGLVEAAGHAMWTGLTGRLSSAFEQLKSGVTNSLDFYVSGAPTAPRQAPDTPASSSATVTPAKFAQLHRLEKKLHRHLARLDALLE